MRQLWLTYAGIAVLILGAIVGSIAWSVTRAPKTKIVTKTHVVTKATKFDGTEAGLLRYLHPRGSGETRCPSNYRPGVRCYVMAGSGWLVQAAFAATGQER